MEQNLRLERALLLPDAPDLNDACVQRLMSLLDGRRGIAQDHIVDSDGGTPTLCPHYDPAVITIAQVERLARLAEPSV